MPDEPGSVGIPGVWVGPEELPILMVNAFLGQVDHQEITLALGQYTPPVIRGDTEDERRQQVQAISYIPIKPVVRVALTRARLTELIAMLEETGRNYDQLQRQMEARGT